MNRRQPSALDDFLFDLRGYLVLKNAVDADLLADLNAAFDNFPPLAQGEWWGNAQRRDYTGDTGFELHNCVEAGEPFEKLIDHPSWIELRAPLLRRGGIVRAGALYRRVHRLDPAQRRAHHPVHSGGYRGALRGRYLYTDGVFRVSQCNVILALTDVGEGDGATMVIPGSHKSNFPHPNQGDYAKGDRMDHLEGAVPLYLDKGDALLFVDGLMHGGSSREKTEGERRVTIYRYGPKWGATRFGYEYSQALLDRLTPERRQILQPLEPLRPPQGVLETA